MPTTREAWIDVGGTFTDCFVLGTKAASEPRLLRGKTLSTGRVPISCLLVSDQRNTSGLSIYARELSHDCDRFWRGARLRVFDRDGEEKWSTLVVGFAESRLQIPDRLPSALTDNTHLLRFEIDAACEAPVLAVHRLLQIPLTEPLPPLRIRLGTTKGTNALLTRGGARTALAITAPFGDLLAIGDQTRPDLFSLAINKFEPLYEVSLPILERLDATGSVLQELDIDDARQQLRRALHQGVDSLAVCLMHSYLNPAHERMLERVAREVGFTRISLSSQLSPVIELVARAQTTVVDAYLSPIVRAYLAKLVAEFGGEDQVQMHVMSSAGGLVDWRQYTGKDSILSGPAGGVAALRGIARASGQSPLIGLDMGGTSTDVCRITPDETLQFESTKAGVKILTPTLPIETVAAGGGSVCWFDGVSLRVGPQSAGADPGPACYGCGGPLTITDINFFLGRIPAEQFPFPVDAAAVQDRLEQMLIDVARQLGDMSIHQLAAGFRALANEQMADAVRTVTTAQGADPRQHTLVGFGGAAGQHICEIAESLGVSQVIDSPDAGLLSALGMGLAVQRLDAVVAVYLPLADCNWESLEQSCLAQEAELQTQIMRQSDANAECVSQRLIELRYAGTDASLSIAWNAPTQILENFQQMHQARFGYARDGHAVEVVAIRLNCQLTAAYRLPASDSVPAIALEEQTPHRPATAAYRQVRRATLPPGVTLPGPAIVLNAGSTLVIENAWLAEVRSDGAILLSYQPATNALCNANERQVLAKGLTHDDLDPIFRDCLGQRLANIATQMGLMLQQTAVSVNVKQRRDFSCAVFDGHGQLLANAPHVPVHLGAMGETVRSILGEFQSIVAGDAFITNDPYRGGSHLPDVTVVSPVFAVNGELVMFVANRAHHADIGGIAPGSMSIDATCLADEGVVIAPRKLTSAGADCSDALHAFLLAAERPPRNVNENMADIAAQLAANTRGIELLNDYAASVGWRTIQFYAEHLLVAAEARVRQYLRSCHLGRREFSDHLDDGTPICLRAEISGEGSLRLDFSGTGPSSPHNFNANPSIVKAAVMYVLRCLIADELPLNEGVLRCVTLVLPEGLLNPKPHPIAGLSPAVAAGNVETSQRIVDVLLGAFGVAAASQGTMNNLLFGNDQFGFYETMCGGAGAIAGHAGASAVHTHMTNTRLTDPEILEAKYPVRLREFRLRLGSGGEGRWPGGDGIVRTIEFLEPVHVSLLTSRRGPYPPFGLAGGKAGQIGHNVLLSRTGGRRQLPACVQLSIEAGQCLEVQTPGGGGYGEMQAPQCLNTGNAP